MSDSMRELESMAEPEERKPVQPKETKATKSTKEKETEPETPVEDEAPETPKAPEQPAKPVKAAELRTAYEKSKETIRTKDAEISRLQNELKAAKSAPVDDPEKKTLVEKLQSVEKRKLELEQQIQFVAYQKSDEFQNKYQKPYEEAWSRAVSELSELVVEAEDGSQRAATAQDLLTLANMPPVDARKLAKTMFGEAADDVLAHRRKIRELADAQTKAIQDAEKNAEAHHKEQQTKSLQQKQQMAKLWEDENKAWRERFPRWFQPEDGDEKGNELLAKGYAMADAAFSSNGNQTPEQRVKLHAELRNKAAAFPKLAYRLKEARSRIKELESSLAEYESSEPKAGEGGKPRATAPGDILNDGFDELDTLARKR